MNPSPCGYHSNYLRIDVSTGQRRRLRLSEQVLRKYVGGVGLGVHILLAEQAYRWQGCQSRAPLVFSFSPLVGSPLTTSAKFAVLCRSPLTGRLSDSLASSHFAISGKRTGSDAICIVGRAQEPSVLVIDGESTTIEPAGALWGLSCQETQQGLRERYGKDYQFAVIGPAGERGVLYATISHDGRHAGRGGSGTVLGSKNLKAIAVRGDVPSHWAHPNELVKLSKKLSTASFGPATEKYRELGTMGNLLVFNRLGTLPTRNFQRSSFEGIAELSPEQLQTTRSKTRKSCAACTIGCEHIYALNDGSSGKDSEVRLEYENMFALGPLCGISDPQLVLSASRYCDDMGLDTISTGGTIAFAMECVERGWLKKPWLRFGDGESLLRALSEIIEGSKFGQLLAQGSRRMAGVIGHDSIDFAPQVKGLEIPGYEPRTLQSMALGFAVNARGADHNRSGGYEVDFSERVDRRNVRREDVRHAVETEDRAALMDSLILCKFLRGVFDDFFLESSQILQLVTGWDESETSLRATARRIVAAKKQFNILAGWTRAEDTLPKRFLQEKLPDDTGELSQQQLASLVDEYYRLRGWDEQGRLPAERAAELCPPSTPDASTSQTSTSETSTPDTSP